jgi:hypothetical protein
LRLRLSWPFGTVFLFRGFRVGCLLGGGQVRLASGGLRGGFPGGMLDLFGDPSFDFGAAFAGPLQCRNEVASKVTPRHVSALEGGGGRVNRIECLSQHHFAAVGFDSLGDRFAVALQFESS